MAASDLVTIANYIDGQFVASRAYIDSYDPSKGEIWARIPDSGSEDVDKAVTAAKKAFTTWSKTTPQERSRILNKIADIIEKNLESLAELESRDQGKPVSLARNVDIPRTVHNFRFFATSVLHQLSTSTYQPAFNALNYTSHEPVGVAGLISPWNLPLYLLSFKIAPAIAHGNTVVCKPSEMTSVSAWRVCQLLKEAGLPSGVVNVVFGTGPNAGDALVRHPEVSLISFTGSTATAEKIRLATAPFCKKLSLELGGKNAAIVFDDADLEKAINTVIRSSFANQGEICLCTSRVYVQKGIYEEFLETFVQKAKEIIVGDPRNSNTWMGALVSEGHMAKVKRYIQMAEDEGATILTGREPNRLALDEDIKQGYYVPPTVITDVSDTSPVMKEEIFGPVVCVVPFESEDDVIKRANDVMYGLCACVWSRDVNKVHRVAKQLQVGTVWANCWLVRDLNMPFGGWKESGVGREGLKASLDFYTEARTVCVQLDK